MHLCARPGRVDAVELADEVGGVPGAFSPYAVYLGGGSPAELAAIADGRAHVQDEGSQLVAAALLAAPIEGPDMRWLDLPGMPGLGAGPTVQLWPHRHGTDAMFLAVLRRTS